MGLKGYKLWVMGQLDSTCRAPPRLAPEEVVKDAEESEEQQVGEDDEGEA
jgi:hypothetical protein